jgi:hypothetical protein
MMEDEIIDEIKRIENAATEAFVEPLSWACGGGESERGGVRVRGKQ